MNVYSGFLRRRVLGQSQCDAFYAPAAADDDDE